MFNVVKLHPASFFRDGFERCASECVMPCCVKALSVKPFCIMPFCVMPYSTRYYLYAFFSNSILSSIYTLIQDHSNISYQSRFRSNKIRAM